MDLEKTEKVTSPTLVNPFLTEKTRRMVCRAFNVDPESSWARRYFLSKLTAGQLKEKIPTYERFCELAKTCGQLQPITLVKAKALYE